MAKLVREAGDHLATGFLGTPLVLPALTATGHLDVAYDVLLQRTNPSWLYQVLAGATTIWERWDALRPDGSVDLDAMGGGSNDSMVSFNHYAYGAVAEWLHTTVAGIAPDADRPATAGCTSHHDQQRALTTPKRQLMPRSVKWAFSGATRGPGSRSRSNFPSAPKACSTCR